MKIRMFIKHCLIWLKSLHVSILQRRKCFLSFSWFFFFNKTLTTCPWTKKLYNSKMRWVFSASLQVSQLNSPFSMQIKQKLAWQANGQLYNEVNSQANNHDCIAQLRIIFCEREHYNRFLLIDRDNNEIKKKWRTHKSKQFVRFIVTLFLKTREEKKIIEAIQYINEKVVFQSSQWPPNSLYFCIIHVYKWTNTSPK